MKKLTLLLLFCYICTSAAGQYFGFGFKAGANYTSFTNGFMGYKLRPLAHAGTITYFGINQHLGVQAEILYSKQGGKVFTGESRPNFFIDYFTFPVMLRYKTKSGFFANGGPVILLRNSQVIENTQIPVTTHKAEFALGAGIGYRASSGVGIELRYLDGISNTGILYNDVNIVNFKTRLLQITLFCLLLFED